MEVTDLLQIDANTRGLVEASKNAGYPAGKLLKELREEKGITQSQMAARLGVSQSVVSRKEKEPDTEFIEEYLYSLDISLRDFDFLKSALGILDLRSLKALKRLSGDEVKERIIKVTQDKQYQVENAKKKTRQELEEILNKLDLLGLDNILAYARRYLFYEENNECFIEEEKKPS